MKKKLFILVLLCFVSLFVICSCGGEQNPPPDKDTGGGTQVEEQLTVTFNSNGGSAVSPVEITKGEKVPKPQDPVLYGHTFLGWFVDGSMIWDFESSTPLKSFTLIGKWEKTKYNINCIGAECSIKTFTPFDEVTLPDGFLKNHDFLGWFVDEDFTTPFTKIEKDTLNDVTVYAKTLYQPFDYELNENGTYTLVGLRDTEREELTIPATYNGIAVTHIGEKAFFNQQNLKKMIISEGVSVIGNDAFKRCYSLNSIELPSTITEIGEDAFYKCDKLSRIFIPIACVKIGRDAFFDCDENLLKIYCEAEEKPVGFDARWNFSFCEVEWSCSPEEYKNK